MRRLSPWSERLMTGVESTFASFVEKHLPRKQKQSATQRFIWTWLTPALFAERTSRRETLLVTTILNSIQTKSCLRGQPAKIDAFSAWNKLLHQLCCQTSFIIERSTALVQDLQHMTICFPRICCSPGVHDPPRPRRHFWVHQLWKELCRQEGYKEARGNPHGHEALLSTVWQGFQDQSGPCSTLCKVSQFRSGLALGDELN